MQPTEDHRARRVLAVLLAVSFALITLEHYLAQLGAWFTIVQGLIFIVCVLTFRRGIVGELSRILKKPL